MDFNIIILGFGVIGSESLFELIRGLKSKNKNINIAIIEKNIDNIPGGVAYSKLNSKHGFFNNPLRLSNLDFIKWIKRKQNIEKLIRFIKINQSYDLNNWLCKNLDFKQKRIKKFSEIYFPRLLYSFFLEDKIIKSLKLAVKKSINIKFYEANVADIKKKNQLIFSSLNKFMEFKPIINNGNLSFRNMKKKITSISSSKVIIGNGILPPKHIYEIKNTNNDNYIWDFYSEGGTNNLINKLRKLEKNKKLIKLVFIGNKAGLLEAIPKLENIITKSNKRFKIISVAKSSLSLEKAEKSKKLNFYKFRFFTSKNIQNLNKSQKILELLSKEFYYAKKSGYNKYDVWTLILKKNIISKCYKKLSVKEKIKYNDKIFPLIRNLTRYTYPETIYSKERLQNRKILTFIKDKVIKIKKNKTNILLITEKNNKILSDILINVSGPVDLNSMDGEVPFIQSLKKINKNYNHRGFFADKNFRIDENIYAPGTLSSNFNPNRLTLIRAVSENSKKAVKHILKN
tara:strand:+ start:1514 stop:3052 length:1539 start_codon:yes stop_codon:yes gene_type:complete